MNTATRRGIRGIRNMLIAAGVALGVALAWVIAGTATAAPAAADASDGTAPIPTIPCPPLTVDDVVRGGASGGGDLASTGVWLLPAVLAAAVLIGLGAVLLERRRRNALREREATAQD